MKKVMILTLVLILSGLLAATGAQADPENMVGQILSDFSVNTINGTFTLSESLKTHDLVLINFWAPWCGPCCMEFPFLEKAWEQRSDRVDVIALSVEETDTLNSVRGFADENGLKFPIGCDENKLFDQMGGTAIPMTLIVDKERRVVVVEIGSKGSAGEFVSLFDSFLSASPFANTTVGSGSVDHDTDHQISRLQGIDGLDILGSAKNFIRLLDDRICHAEQKPQRLDQVGYYPSALLNVWNHTDGVVFEEVHNGREVIVRTNVGDLLFGKGWLSCVCTVNGESIEIVADQTDSTTFRYTLPENAVINFYWWVNLLEQKAGDEMSGMVYFTIQRNRVTEAVIMIFGQEASAYFKTVYGRFNEVNYTKAGKEYTLKYDIQNGRIIESSGF